MPAPRAPLAEGVTTGVRLIESAKYPGLRALAWNKGSLYASRGYTLLRGRVSADKLEWEQVGRYRPAWWRNLSSASRLGFRLFRDGFHALGVLPSGELVGAVPGAIVRLGHGDAELTVTHRVLRGTRPLHIAVTPTGQVFWGEYFDNSGRNEVHIYASTDAGLHWEAAYTFPRLAIRHVHNIVYDRWEDCLWVLTGDEGAECRILKVSPDFKHVDTVLAGNQQARAVALVPMPDGVYFSSDTPYEKNHIYRLDRNGTLAPQADLSSSSIYGCRVGGAIFFSTMVEPSEANPDRNVCIFGRAEGLDWQAVASWKKDNWSMKYFQFGNAFLPDGDNESDMLAATTLGVRGADLQTHVWRVASGHHA